MKKKTRYLMLGMVLVLLQLCVFCAAEAAGQTYYVDIEIGSDTNSGLSQEEPWRTAERLTGLQAGDTVLFRAGQSWENVYVKIPCNDVTIGAYGTGERPVLSGAVTAQGWEEKKNLSLPEGYQSDSDTLYILNIQLDKDPYLIKAGNTLFRRTNSETIGDGTYYYDRDAGCIYLVSKQGNPDILGVTQIQQQPHIFYIHAKSNIVIRDLHMTMTGGAGVNIQSADSRYIKVENNEIDYAESYDSDGSGINCASVKFSQFNNNVIHDVFGDGIMLWNCEGNLVSGNQIWNVFRGNNTGGDGIQSAGKAGNAAPDNQIVNNQINMSNSGTGKGCIQQENGDRAVITGNLCLYGSFGVECNSNYGVVKNNICAYQGTQTPYNWTAGIYMSENEDITGMVIADNIIYQSRPYGIRLGGPAENYRGDFEIYNNTIYSNGTPFAALTSFGGTVKNNIFYDTAKKASGSVYNVSSVKEGGEVISDHNVFYPVRDGFIAWQGTAYNTIWAFREVVGMELQSRISEPVFYGSRNGWSDTPKREEFRLYAHSPGAKDGGEIISNGETVYVKGCAAGAVQDLIPSQEEDIKDPEKPGEEEEPVFRKGLIAYEGFSYDALIPGDGIDGGTGWKDSWECIDAKIDPETLTYDGVYATGRKLLFQNRISRTLREPIGTENGTYYIGFLIKNATGYGLTVTLSAGEGQAMYIRKEPKSNWQVKLRKKWMTAEEADSRDGFILIRLNVKDSRTDLALWVNPDLSEGETGLGEPDVSDYAGEKITPGKISFSIAEGAAAYAQIDEIRIASNLEGATRQIYQVPPAPGAGALQVKDANGIIHDGVYYDAIAGELKGSVYVYNTPDHELSGRIYAALKKDGFLVDLKEMVFTLEPGETANKEFAIDFDAFTDDDYTLQLFCWEVDGMKPLGKAETIHIYKSIDNTQPKDE